MNLISDKKIKKIYLTKRSSLEINSKVDLVLSPEFYWIRSFDIPVKTQKEALQVLPTLYEDTLPEQDFEYYCVKIEENKFLCFAYNNDIILEHIKNSGLSLSQINTVFFAQFQMINYKSFEIDGNSYLYEKNILIKIPANVSIDTESLSSELSETKVNTNKINMKFYSNVMSSKYIYTLVILLSFLIGINTIRYFSFSNENNNINVKVEKMKNSYDMPQTNIQTKSILGSMQREVTTEIKLRRALSYIFEFKKSRNNEVMEKISFKENKIKMVFTNITWLKIKRHIEKKYTISSNNTSGNFVTVVVEI